MRIAVTFRSSAQFAATMAGNRAVTFIGGEARGPARRLSLDSEASAHQRASDPTSHSDEPHIGLTQHQTSVRSSFRARRRAGRPSACSPANSSA